jgi:uncharacterized protein DUF6662
MKLKILMVCVSIILWAGSAFASESQFGFVYTTDLLPKSKKEVEQWLTYRFEKNSGSFNMLEARTAFEYGLADNFQGALYANYAWAEAFHNGPDGVTTPPEQFSHDEPGPDAHYNAAKFIGISAEGIYRVLSPYKDPIGLALYLEPTFGPNFIELESKLILQKNFFDDTLTLAFNFTYAPEFRRDPGDDSWNEETDVNFNFATSYRVVRNWSVGFEFLNEQEYASLNFSHLANCGYFIGPSIHYGGKKFFVTAVYVRQLPLATNHSDTVPGAIVNGYIGDNDFEKNRIRIKTGFYF